ncbi:hypothetical protein SE15_02415 [Thermanaerothrix daxensis]|uniref:Uncharacterized protein n=1 Tax=Thermanaerothrix daxensis TaxID=869279 RepID=A0A0P6XKV4_9CHLR|nr:hypothetical protein SE15_02415 [Thermanaerothrix daxensis]
MTRAERRQYLLPVGHEFPAQPLREQKVGINGAKVKLIGENRPAKRTSAQIQSMRIRAPHSDHWGAPTEQGIPPSQGGWQRCVSNKLGKECKEESLKA